VVLATRAEGNTALAAVFSSEYPKLVRLAFLLTSDNALAEELAQESFVRAWSRRSFIQKEEALPAYLRRTVVNLANSSLRRRRLERRALVARGEEASQPDPARHLDCIQALRGLPSRQRACVVLRYYEDLTEVQVAELLGISVGTVKSQTHKALQKIKESLGGDRYVG